MFNANQDQFDYFIAECEARQLRVELGQIVVMSFRNKKSGTTEYSSHVTLDGLRVIAERSGLYAGQKGPLFLDKDGKTWLEYWPYDDKPLVAKAAVYRKGWKEPVWFAARLKSYLPKSQDFKWQDMPEIMLGKCAISGALKAAFPGVMTGIVTDSEVVEVADEPAQIKMPGVKERVSMMISAFEKQGVAMETLEQIADKKLADFKNDDIELLSEVYRKIKDGTDVMEISIKEGKVTVDDQ
jgi:phage recombination protein Bet